jgi:uncharacterized membrane protein YraQ (UPF0718 family)
MTILETIWEGLENALLMAWTVWWALVLGFAISAIVQAWVPRERIEHGLGASGPRPVAVATGLGAASSSCSYAAVAIARSLFAKGASAASALAFQFASTNLVVELGILMWILIGWQFTLADFVGGLVLVLCMTLLLRQFVSKRMEAQARSHAQAGVDAGQGQGDCHRHEQTHAALPLRDGVSSLAARPEVAHNLPLREHVRPLAAQPEVAHNLPLRERVRPLAAQPEVAHNLPLRERVRSLAAWTEVAHNFRRDWTMLYKEIAIGLVLAGFIGLLGNDFFNNLFITSAPEPLRLLENVLVGPLIAVASFVCSIGNVPLAAVLWSGGIGFGGVLAFIFADLLIVPIVLIYRKYYGARFATRIVILMFVAVVVAALIVDGIFAAVGLIPHVRPTRAQVFGEVEVNYELFANAIGLAVFATLFALTRARTRTRVP